jgi:hypothetical protein
MITKPEMIEGAEAFQRFRHATKAILGAGPVRSPVDRPRKQRSRPASEMSGIASRPAAI